MEPNTLAHTGLELEQGISYASVLSSSLTVTGGYRFGFNGMEKDDEMKKDGNSYDFGARIFDPRMG